MLNQVILQTPVPMVLDLDAATSDDIIIVKSISGLEPVDVTLFTGEYARAGGYYQGRRPGKRNPVWNLKLNPNYKDNIEVSDIRELLYETFYEPTLSGDGLRVVLKDDRRPDRTMVCYCEKFPHDMFSKDTSVAISTICTDPYLRSVDKVSVTDGAGFVSLPIDYVGSAKTGLEMTIKMTNASNQLTIVVDGKAMILNKYLPALSVITINTVEGERYIRLDGQDIMGALVGRNWATLRRGINQVKVYGEAENDGKARITHYEYRGAWWGV